jgi:cytidylate kinase
VGEGTSGRQDVPRGLVVAVDGPSGSGKSTVSRRVAASLGVRYLDTGAMYRALTWWALDQGVDLADGAAVADLARRLPLDMVQDPDQPRVVVGEVDVTAAIRETRVSEAVSAVATNLDVRAELVRRQRELIAAAVEQTGGAVAEGRDITTVVAPDAPVRILLTADESARLARRALEVHGEDSAEALAATRAQVVVRDAKDSTVSQFLAPADGVVEIDSSHLGIDEVVAAVLAQVERVAPGLAAGR